jgi:hypothetical protein
MTTSNLAAEVSDLYGGYAEPEQLPPFRSYAVLTAVLNGAFAAALLGARVTGRLPCRTDVRASHNPGGGLDVHRADDLRLHADCL